MKQIPSGVFFILIWQIDKKNSYDVLINEYREIDLALIGIGTNGHTGFNEPGLKINSVTRVVNLTESTIKSNNFFQWYFFSAEKSY